MRLFRDKKLSQDLVLLGVGLCMLWPARALASLHVDLDGDWQFRIDPGKQGEARGWMRQLPDGTETVRVPHSCNIGKYEDFKGTAWYFRLIFPFFRLTGFVAGEQTLDWWEPRSAGFDIEDMKHEGKSVPE